MSSAINWEVHTIVIERSWYPCLGIMTIGAVGWELGCLVVRVCGIVVISLVTSIARVRGVYVTAHMTCKTVILKRLVCTGQLPVLIVIEC